MFLSDVGSGVSEEIERSCAKVSLPAVIKSQRREAQITDTLLTVIVLRRVLSLSGALSIHPPRYVEKQIEARVVTIPLSH